MKADPTEIEKYLKALEETPHRISMASNGIEDWRLQLTSDKKSWSANDILAHLRSCADLWTHSIYAMLAEHQPVLPDIDFQIFSSVFIAARKSIARVESLAV